MCVRARARVRVSVCKLLKYYINSIYLAKEREREEDRDEKDR